MLLEMVTAAGLVLGTLAGGGDDGVGVADDVRPAAVVLAHAGGGTLATARPATTFPTAAATEPASTPATVPPTTSTTTSLDVGRRADGSTALGVAVSSAAGRPRGAVEIRVGLRTLAVLPLDGEGRTALVTSDVVGDDGEAVTARYLGQGPHAGSAASVVPRAGTATSAGSVTVAIPAGALVVSAPAAGAVRLDPVAPRLLGDRLRLGVARATVTDTRAGAGGFTLTAAVAPLDPAPGGPGWVLLGGVEAEGTVGSGVRTADAWTPDVPVRLDLGGGAVVVRVPQGGGRGGVAVQGAVVVGGDGSGGVRLVWTLV